MDREKDIEKRMKQKIEASGGLCFKFLSPGNAGVPDRIAVLPRGTVWFLELKTETGELSHIQEWQIRRLRDAGANVAVKGGRRG